MRERQNKSQTKKTKQKKQQKLILGGKRIRVIANTNEDMMELINSENVPELKQAYQEMLDGMKNDSENWFWYTYWRIELRSDHSVIGGVCFKGAPQELCEVEIGYGIHDEYQRQGYGYEAVKAMIDWALTNEKVYFITAETDVDNVASQGLLQKLGFQKTERSGEEGPIFEIEKPPASNFTTFMCLGISIGICFGISIFDNIGVGIAFGVGIGSMMGYGLDQTDKKKRTELKQKRNIKN